MSLLTKETRDALLAACGGVRSGLRARGSNATQSEEDSSHNFLQCDNQDNDNMDYEVQASANECPIPLTIGILAGYNGLDLDGGDDNKLEERDDCSLNSEPHDSMDRDEIGNGSQFSDNPIDCNQNDDDGFFDERDVIDNNDYDDDDKQQVLVVCGTVQVLV
jgi:hypothetical protein